MIEKVHTLTKQQRRLVLGLSCLIFMSVLNGTMFNVALPEMMKDFHLTESEVSWVLVAYGLVFAIGAVTYGKLADLFPIRRLIMIGVSLFVTGSLLGFISSEYAWIVASRILQSSGSSAIPALAMITATKYFPIEKRGMVLGTIASVVAFGMGVGPLVGGGITQWLGWPFLFIISVLVVFALPIVIPALPKESPKTGSFDLLGALLFAGGVSCLLIAANTNAWTVIPGIFLFLFFARHIKRHKDPFIKLHLFENKSYRLLLCVGFLIFFCLSSSIFVLPIMLEKIHALQAGSIGAVLFPGTMIAAVLGTKAGKWSDQYGSAKVISGATLLMGSSFILLAVFLHISPLFISILLILTYLGFSANQSALANYVSLNLKSHEIGVGMGLYNLIAFVGGTFGPAIISRFLVAHPLVGDSIVYSHAYSILFIICAIILPILYLVNRYTHPTLAVKLQK